MCKPFRWEMINTTKYTTVANMSHLKELRHSVSQLHPINSELNEELNLRRRCRAWTWRQWWSWTLKHKHERYIYTRYLWSNTRLKQTSSNLASIAKTEHAIGEEGKSCLFQNVFISGDIRRYVCFWAASSYSSSGEFSKRVSWIFLKSETTNTTKNTNYSVRLCASQCTCVLDCSSGGICLSASLFLSVQSFGKHWNIENNCCAFPGEFFSPSTKPSVRCSVCSVVLFLSPNSHRGCDSESAYNDPTKPLTWLHLIKAS